MNRRTIEAIVVAVNMVTAGASFAQGTSGRVPRGPIRRGTYAQTRPLASRQYAQTAPIQRYPISPRKYRSGVEWDVLDLNYKSWDFETSFGGIYQGPWPGNDWKDIYSGRSEDPASLYKSRR